MYNIVGEPDHANIHWSLEPAAWVRQMQATDSHTHTIISCADQCAGSLRLTQIIAGIPIMVISLDL